MSQGLFLRLRGDFVAHVSHLFVSSADGGISGPRESLLSYS